MKIKKLFLQIFTSLGLFLFALNSKAFAQAKPIQQTEPARVRDVETIFAQSLSVLWALSIPYFMYMLIMIGARWMLSFGDETKQGELKKRGGNFVLSMVMVFGGYLVVKMIISLLGFKNPDPSAPGKSCFDDGTDVSDPFFQVFFPEICKGV